MQLPRAAFSLVPKPRRRQPDVTTTEAGDRTLSARSSRHRDPGLHCSTKLQPAPADWTGPQGTETPPSRTVVPGPGRSLERKNRIYETRRPDASGYQSRATSDGHTAARRSRSHLPGATRARK